MSRTWLRPPSRKERREALSEAPKSFFGSELDRVLALGANHPEVVKRAGVKEEAPEGFTPLVAKPHTPLIAVLYDNHCKCGCIFPSFGFFAHKNPIGFTQCFGHDSDKPDSYIRLPNEVPICFNCIPNGLPYVGN
jgi:hypothetical protein